MPEIRLSHNLWILVADGEKALFLRNAGTVPEPDLQVVRQMYDENPPTREQGTDRPGRLNDGNSTHRSAVEETDWHRIEKARFASEIAARLYKLVHRGAFRKIVLVAPPLVLGELRKTMHKEVADRVVCEVAKTLTNHKLDDIEKVLRQG